MHPAESSIRRDRSVGRIMIVLIYKTERGSEEKVWCLKLQFFCWGCLSNEPDSFEVLSRYVRSRQMSE